MIEYTTTEGLLQKLVHNIVHDEMCSKQVDYMCFCVNVTDYSWVCQFWQKIFSGEDN